MNKQLAALTLAISIALPARPAEADELTEAAKKVFDEAVDAYEKKEFAVCRTKAAGAWEQFKAPRILAVLGLCEAELGLHREAANHFEAFLANPKDASPKQLAQIREKLEVLRPKLGRVRVKPTPADAEVTLGGEAAGRGEVARFVDPGDVVVAVTKGGQSRTRTVTVRAGGEETLTIEVPLGSGGGDPGGGGAGAGDGAGGAGAGGTGAGGTGGAGGEDPGGDDKPLWPTLVLAGVGAVGVGTGIGLTVASLGAYADAEEQAGCSPFTSACETAGRDALESADGLMTGAIVSFSVGGAALVGMAIWLAIPAGDSNVALVPTLGPSVNGLTMKGSF